MSSQAWNPVVSVQAAVVAFVTAGAYNASLAPESQLKLCRNKIYDIKTYINDLSPDRRERWRIAAALGKLWSLETLEHELPRLLDECAELAERAEKSSFLERTLPTVFSQLQANIHKLNDAVKRLMSDTWDASTSLRDSESEDLQEMEITTLVISVG